MKLKVKKQLPQKVRVKNSLRDTLLVIGLGNPGREYEKTRHNAGFLVLNELAERFSLKFKKPFFHPWRCALTDIQTEGGTCRLVLVQPLTYMNASGTVLPDLLCKFSVSPEKLVIICDTLDLSPGIIRIKGKGSSGGQRGLASILSMLGTERIRRIVVGIGRPEDNKEVVDWVLTVPGDEEVHDFMLGVRKAADALLDMTRLPLERVMNNFNESAKK